ncbi:hypothetical protein [Mycobacterium sp. Aquia_213]|uniref:hypothetical protein n=1 Tax=Mycobacterium sp. Aquia_213 TaxID=2991728 RepID=UPI002271760D|nr:hypothetical protein [Mycobacterium sp. Aquia_213]WAC93847.1 hypothetical protein LMQ14_12400 [Mycobacterium sp. Aquia_213]
MPQELSSRAVTVDECAAGRVEALGESCEGTGGELEQFGFLADDGEQSVVAARR